MEDSKNCFEDLKEAIMNVFNKFPTIKITPLPTELINDFINDKIKEREERSKHLKYYIKLLANKMHKTPYEVTRWMSDIYEVYPAAVLSILLRVIAVDLDKKYPDHIRNSEDIYIISTIDGRICKTCKAKIKSYRNFAAFRTIEDARFACKVMSSLLRDMFAK